MRIASLADLTTTPAAPAHGKAAEAVRDFEAILIGQMLKTARESGGGSWLSSEEDSASSPALEFAEQQLARTMADAGGLGLARMIAPLLEKNTHQE